MPFVKALGLAIVALMGPTIVTGRVEWLLASPMLAMIVFIIALIGFSRAG